MIEPEIKTHYEEQSCKFEVPMDRIYLRHGYKERDSVQVRYDGGQGDEAKIYLCDSREGRYPDKIVAARIPFDIFLKAWPNFIEHVAALTHEAQQQTEQK